MKTKLTFKQLKKLISESYDEEVQSRMYRDWLAFINQFGAEETAKVLAYKNRSGTFGIDLGDVLINYADDKLLHDDEDIYYSMHKKASDEGLEDYSVDLYGFYVGTKYEKFLIETTGEGFGRKYSGLDKLEYDFESGISEKALKLLDSNQIVLVVTHEISTEEDPEYPDDLSWDSAKSVAVQNYNIVEEGKTDKCEYMILTSK